MVNSCGIEAPVWHGKVFFMFWGEAMSNCIYMYIHRRLRETVFSSCWVIFAFKNGIYPIHLPFTYWLDLVNSTSWSSAQTLQCFEHGTHPHASFDARLPCRKWFCILSESVLPGIQNWPKQESTGNKTKRWRKTLWIRAACVNNN